IRIRGSTPDHFAKNRLHVCLCIMLTPQAVTPSTPEITPKKRERLTPRNTARSNLPEDRHRTATYNSAVSGVFRHKTPLCGHPRSQESLNLTAFAGPLHCRPARNLTALIR